MNFSKINNGQALVELALTLPILLLLIMGTLDVGRAFYVKIVLTNSAREGVYYLAQNPTDAADSYAGTILAVQNEAASSGVVIAPSQVSVTDCCTRALPVSVTVSNNLELSFLQFLFGTLDLTGTVRMLVP